MANGNRSGPDWDRFEKLIGTRFPFVPKGFMKNRMNAGGDWIGEYVEEVLKQSFQTSGMPGAEEEKEAETSSASIPQELDYEYEVFETHASVIARVKVPEEVLIRNVRVYAGSNQLKLEQDPSRRKLYIPLPRTVDSNAARATFKERVLEIRLPKMDEAELFQEVRVRNL